MNINIPTDFIEVVDNWKNGKYYESKQRRLASIPMSNKGLVEKVILTIAEIPYNDIPQIQAVAASLTNKIYGHDTHRIFEHVKTAFELLAILKDKGFYEIYDPIYINNPHDTYVVKRTFSLNDRLKEAVKRNEKNIVLHDKPRNWIDNSDGGYEFNSSLLLGNRLSKHQEYQAYDVVNILQSIEWELDQDILKFDEPVTNTRSERDLAREYYNDILPNNKFHFVWKYDKRGRTYSQGYHINLQSTEYKKASLNFKNKEVISSDIITGE